MRTSTKSFKSLFYKCSLLKGKEKEMKMNIKKSDISDANIERLTKLYKQNPTPEKQKELEMLINLSTIVNIGNDMFNSK